MIFHVVLIAIALLLIIMVCRDFLKNPGPMNLVAAIILIFAPLYLFFDTWSPVSQKEYNCFVDRKAYIEAYEPASEIDAAAIGAEMYERNTWLEEKQTQIRRAEWMYIGIPDGFLEETPIQPK